MPARTVTHVTDRNLDICNNSEIRLVFHDKTGKGGASMSSMLVHDGRLTDGTQARLTDNKYEVNAAKITSAIGRAKSTPSEQSFPICVVWS